MSRDGDVPVAVALALFLESLYGTSRTREPPELAALPEALPLPPRPCGDPLFDGTLGGLRPGVVTLVHGRLPDVRSLVLANLVLSAARSGIRVRVALRGHALRPFVSSLMGLSMGMGVATFDGRSLSRSAHFADRDHRDRCIVITALGAS